METENQVNESKPDNASFKIPLIIFGVLGSCGLVSLIVFCSVAFLFTRAKGNLPITLLATPVPTVDIVKVVDDDPMWWLIINDGVDKNEHGWPINAYQGEGVDLERKLENGKYIWEFNAQGGWSFYGYPKGMDQYTNFVVSAEFVHTQGALFDGYGFVMRATGDRHYFFRISELGRYAFGYRSNDSDTILLEGQTRLIRAGQPNQVTVRAEGTRFTIYVNNYQIAVVEDSFISSGWVGLLLSPTGIPVNGPGSDAQDTTFSSQSGSPSRFEVDNFKLWIPAVKDNAANRTPSPSLQPKGGHLVFVSSRDGNREIYSLDTTSGEVVRLTNDPAEDYAPKWSPNGKQIIFVSTREGDPDIFIMDSDGTHIQKLTDDPADDLDPSWSPDGKQIVFASNRSGHYNLYVLDVDTKSVERLTDEASNDRHPDWSPKDNVILFQSDRKNSNEIFSVSVNTRMVTQITNHDTTDSAHPVWAPVGLAFLYELILDEGHSGIATSDFPGGHFQTVVGVSDSSLWPAWSPDGSQIAFVSNRDGQTDIYIVDKDGIAIHRLTDNPAVESELDWTAE